MYEINTLKEIVTRQEDRITKLENRIKYLEKVTLNWDE